MHPITEAITMRAGYFVVSLIMGPLIILFTVFILFAMTIMVSALPFIALINPEKIRKLSERGDNPKSEGLQ